MTGDHALNIASATLVIARIKVLMARRRTSGISSCRLDLMRRPVVDCKPSLVSVDESITVDFTVLNVLLRKGATLGNESWPMHLLFIYCPLSFN